MLIQRYIERRHRDTWRPLRDRRLSKIRSLGLDFLGVCNPSGWPQFEDEVSTSEFRSLPEQQQNKLNNRAKTWWDKEIFPRLAYQEVGPDHMRLVTSTIDSYAQAFTVEEIASLEALEDAIKRILRYCHPSDYIETHSQFSMDVGGWYNALRSNYSWAFKNLEKTFMNLCQSLAEHK